MRPFKDALPLGGDRVLYLFYDFETKQNKSYSEKASIHVSNLVCVKQFCSQCEGVEDCGDCMRCGQWKHSF